MKIILFALLLSLLTCVGCTRDSSEKIQNSVTKTLQPQVQINLFDSSGVTVSDTLTQIASQPTITSSAPSFTNHQPSPDELEQFKKYEIAKLEYQAKIDAALVKYRAIPITSDVRPLIELDKELIAISKTDPGETRNLDKKEYSEISFGIVGSYGLGYTGGILVEAHKRNPHSPYREDTLFAMLMSESDNGIVVRLEPIYRYLQEYPSGKHTGKAYMAIGDAYRDLYRVLWEFETNDRNKGGYGYKCYEHFVTKEPYSLQMKNTRAAAIDNYKKALKHITEYVEFYNDQIATTIKHLESKKKPEEVMACGLAGD